MTQQDKMKLLVSMKKRKDKRSITLPSKTPVLMNEGSFLIETTVSFTINLTRERPILFFYSKEELNAVILKPKYQKFIWGNLFYRDNSLSYRDHCFFYN